MMTALTFQTRDHCSATILQKNRRITDSDERISPMTKLHSPLLILVIAASLIGCQDPHPVQPQVAPAEFAKANQDAKAVSEDLDSYTYAQRTAFTEKIQLQLDQLNTDLDGLSHQVEKFQGPAKDEAAKKLAVLRAQSLAIAQRLQKASSSDESGWNDIKSGIRKGYQEFKDSMNDTRQWVSDKIAP